jgi:hypothetical protein
MTMKRDDCFLRQDFCGKKKRSLLQQRNSEKIFEEHERFGPKNTKPSKKKNTKTKNPKITIFQPNLLKYHSKLIKHFLKNRPSTKNTKIKIHIFLSNTICLHLNNTKKILINHKIPKNNTISYE